MPFTLKQHGEITIYLFIDDLARAITTYNDKEIRTYADFIITQSKNHIRLIQQFESALVENAYLTKETTTNHQIAYFILDRFFECLNDLSMNTFESFNIERINYNVETKDSYTLSPYLPNLIDIEDYFSGEHSMRLSMLEDDDSKSAIQDKLRDVYSKLKSGEYDYLGKYFPFHESIKLSSIDLKYFKRAYFILLEPLIIGSKRFEYEALTIQR